MIISETKSKLLENVLEKMNLIRDIQYSVAVLGWDQETYMPEASAQSRANQIASLETLAHQEITSQKSADYVKKIEDNICQKTDAEHRLLNLFVNEYNKSIKLPKELVSELAKQKAISVESWKIAKHKKDFKIYEKDLEKLTALKREEAKCLQNSDSKNLYDALIGEFEPNTSVDKLSVVFSNLKKESLDLLSKIDFKSKNSHLKTPKHAFSKNKQIKLSKMIAKKMGFDFTRGRLDLSEHPFTTSFSKFDVRITTRQNKYDFLPCFYSTIHEVGHALYEQGIDDSLSRTFAEEGSSIGIHESQSLIWENVICRSFDFWKWASREVKHVFPENFENWEAVDFYKFSNKIDTGFIRTESDELTYNLHIILRFELENLLINDKIKVKEIPEFWNSKMKEYLGLEVKSDDLGCLQDIHWAFGGYGYFPSYTLGKLYAAMIWNEIKKDFPDYQTKLANGELLFIRRWLKDQIHKCGKLYTPEELIQKIAHRPLSSEDFTTYIKEKINSIY
jgi:carboxypeptidase Taq